MADKRMAASYEITQALHIGERGVVFGIDVCQRNFDPYHRLKNERRNLDV